jgi:hypothetical protein
MHCMISVVGEVGDLMLMRALMHEEDLKSRLHYMEGEGYRIQRRVTIPRFDDVDVVLLG